MKRKKDTVKEDDLILQEVLRLMNQKPLPRKKYYFISMLGDENGEITRYVYTEWAGFTDTKPRREIRKAAFVDTDKLIFGLKRVRQPGVIVNDIKDLYIYFMIGGHGIVIESLAEKFFTDLIKPRETIRSHSKGFIFVNTLPAQSIQHAPSKKLRMKVLKRDMFCCKICGRSPKNYVDIELHVHHILPWGEGGITESDNLLTLCSTCHDGLEPHYESSLFDLINVEMLQDSVTNNNDYVKGVKLYCEMCIEAWKQQNR